MAREERERKQREAAQKYKNAMGKLQELKKNKVVSRVTGEGKQKRLQLDAAKCFCFPYCISLSPLSLSL